MKGFTLIEMIVVITIIAVLSSISFLSYSTVQRNARDTKRQSDLKVIQSALEQYRADQSYYPLTLSFDSSLTSPTGSKIYLNRIPNDPVSVVSYDYEPYPVGCTNASAAANCSGYCLYAKVENDSTKNTRPSFCPPAAHGPDAQYNYTVTPL